MSDTDQKDSPAPSADTKAETTLEKGPQGKKIYDLILGLVMVTALGLTALFFSITPKGYYALLKDTGIKLNRAKAIYKDFEDAEQAKNEKARKKNLVRAHTQFKEITTLTGQLRKMPECFDLSTQSFKKDFKAFADYEREAAKHLTRLTSRAKPGDFDKKKTN